MNRVKTFDSTGIAPNGRLFAGDLNAIQDAAAALTDFAQTISAGSLRVGATDVQLSRFGTNEGQFSGHLRTLGILRGLGGIVSGAFTTTQRDAIAAGSRPYGMIILNTTTNRYEVNEGTDAVPVWKGIGRGITDGDIAAAAAISGTKLNLSGSVHLSGTAAARTNAIAIANPGALYFTTDEGGGTMYRSNGATWDRVAPGQKPNYCHFLINHGYAGGPDAFYRVPNNGALVYEFHNGVAWIQSVVNLTFKFPVAGKYKFSLGSIFASDVGGAAATFLLDVTAGAFAYPAARGNISVGQDPAGAVPQGGISAGPFIMDVADATHTYQLGGYFSGGSNIRSWMTAEQITDY